MESPPEGYPHDPPPPLREPLPHIFQVLDGKCGLQVRDLLVRITRGRGGEGGVICEMVRFNNESSIDCKLKMKIANTVVFCFFVI